MTESSGVRERVGEDSEATEAADRCPDCERTLVYDDTETERHCPDCGYVVETDGIDRGPEWRAYDTQERTERSRVGAPMTQMLHDRGMSTKIGWRDEDAHGNAVTDRKRRQLRRLRTWNERYRATGSKDRNLKQALGEIDRMAAALGLPRNVRETASVIYRRALDEELLPGRSIEGVGTAALYAAARMENVARSIDEMAAVSRIDGMELKRTYRYLSRELELGIAPTNPAEYIGRFASAVDCSEATERRARELIERVVEEGIHSGKHPVGIAASALYGAAQLTDETLTQEDISNVANVSKVTIRNRYTEVMQVASGSDTEST